LVKSSNFCYFYKYYTLFFIAYNSLGDKSMLMIPYNNLFYLESYLISVRINYLSK
jgi:hypothetical protein